MINEVTSDGNRRLFMYVRLHRDRGHRAAKPDSQIANCKLKFQIAEESGTAYGNVNCAAAFHPAERGEYWRLLIFIDIEMHLDPLATK